MVIKPKLTVITINYNNSAGLDQTLRSVRQQSNRNFEYLIVDGGSTDDSLSIIQKNLDIISRWSSEKDNGEYDGMNKGIRQARGKYLMFLNSGDTFFDENSVNNLLSIDFTEDFVFGDVCIDYGYTMKIKKYPDTLGYWFLYSEMICHQVQVIRAQLFHKLGGYNTKIKIVADYDFMIHALVGKKVSYRHVSHTLAIYRWGGKSTQPEAAEIIRQGKESIRKNYFSKQMYSVLQEFDRTTFTHYQQLKQSRAYQALRAMEHVPGLLWMISAAASFALRLRDIFSAFRQRSK